MQTDNLLDATQDKDGVAIGVLGELFEGIRITEVNRQSTWETTREGKLLLRKILHDSFLSRGVKAVLYGCYSHRQVQYAIFVDYGFLLPTEPELP